MILEVIEKPEPVLAVQEFVLTYSHLLRVSIKPKPLQTFSELAVVEIFSFQKIRVDEKQHVFNIPEKRKTEKNKNSLRK